MMVDDSMAVNVQLETQKVRETSTGRMKLLLERILSPKDLAMKTTDDKAVTVLAVTGNPGTAQRLSELFRRTRWNLALATSCGDARRQLEQNPPSVILCDAKLSDGNWREVLEKLRALENPPNMIVTSNQADENLWTEVLSEGAFDLLPRPFERTELFRVVSLAWRDWWHHHESARAATA